MSEEYADLCYDGVEIIYYASFARRALRAARCEKKGSREGMTSRFELAMEKLKTTGVRMTPQRHAILTYLLDSKVHPTADELYKALESRFPSISVATIYNNLKLFVSAELIRELNYGDSSSRFDADLSEHYHAICETCGTISDFDYPQLVDVERAAAVSAGMLVRGHRLEVYGVCGTCRT